MTKTNFNPKKFITKAIAEIKKEIGNKRAVCALSGGVDSTTCSVLAHQAVGKNFLPVFLDDGLMRTRDEKEVVATGKKMGLKVTVVRVAPKFFAALTGKLDPEEKRKAFRTCFYKTLGGTVKKYKADFLIQGTIAADIVETKGKIKTQHNVLSQIGIDPQKFGFQAVEPLRELYKPEVRRVAQALGLPKTIFGRMPFPGPGLATRIVGEVTEEKVKTVKLATEIVEEELEKYRPFQCFAVLLNDKATGIVNGQRLLGQIIAIRSVESKDAIKARPSKIPWEILEKIQRRITEEIPSVVKVVYDLTPKPPSTIEYI